MWRCGGRLTNTEIQSRIGNLQVPDSAPQEPPYHQAQCETCPRSSSPQRSERNPCRDTIQILDTKWKELYKEDCWIWTLIYTIMHSQHILLVFMLCNYCFGTSCKHWWSCFANCGLLLLTMRPLACCFC